MKHFFLFFTVVLVAFQCQSQGIETVKIAKEKSLLFRGVSQEIRDYYLYCDEQGVFYLASLKIAQNEIENWFITRKDSQNIYKGILQAGQYKTLDLTKANEPGIPLNFYFETKEENLIELISIDDGKLYQFKQIETH